MIALPTLAARTDAVPSLDNFFEVTRSLPLPLVGSPRLATSLARTPGRLAGQKLAASDARSLAQQLDDYKAILCAHKLHKQKESQQQLKLKLCGAGVEPLAPRTADRDEANADKGSPHASADAARETDSPAAAFVEHHEAAARSSTRANDVEPSAPARVPTAEPVANRAEVSAPARAAEPAAAVPPAFEPDEDSDGSEDTAEEAAEAAPSELSFEQVVEGFSKLHLTARHALLSVDAHQRALAAGLATGARAKLPLDLSVMYTPVRDAAGRVRPKQIAAQGEAVLHFGGAPQVHDRCLAELADKLRASASPFSVLSRADAIDVLRRATIERRPRYRAIFRVGALAQHVFVLVDGCLELTHVDGSGAGARRPSYGPSAPGPVLFGLDACTELPVRLGSAIVDERALVMALHVDSLPDALVAECRRRVVAELLSRAKVLAGVAWPLLCALAPCFTLQANGADALLLRQHDPVERFHLLVGGRVSSVRQAAAGDGGLDARLVDCGTLHPGAADAFFGEVALFAAAWPAAASIVTRDLAFTLALDSAGVGALLEAVPDLRARCERARAAGTQLGSTAVADDWLEGLQREFDDFAARSAEKFHMGVSKSYMQLRVDEAIALGLAARLRNRAPVAQFALARAEIQRRETERARLWPAASTPDTAQ
jgi:hypothetical protein